MILLLFKVTIGIRTDSEVEQMGLDVSEHGMWGYPEFYIPVPGGYGSEQNIRWAAVLDREVIVSRAPGRQHVRRPVRQGRGRPDGETVTSTNWDAQGRRVLR